jgi:hypothetical protein
MPEGPLAVSPRSIEQLKAIVRAPRPQSTRPDLALLSHRSAVADPCATMRGAWRLSDGEVMTLMPGGRGTWSGPGSRPGGVLRWACHASGAITVELPGGVLRLTLQEGGLLGGLNASGAALEARR